MSPMPTGARLLRLLQLCDSLFPTGGFAHSDGLEAATDARLVASADDLRQWMAACLDETLGRSDGPAVLMAVEWFLAGRLDALEELDAEVHALRPSSAARQASRAMGARLLKTWQRLHPHPDIERLLASTDRGHTLPVAFGVVCASTGLDARTAAEAFVYTRLAATASCAMRLMPIGQSDAHAVLASVLAGVPDVVEAMVARRHVEAFAPVLDVVVMSQQYVHSRLFRS